MRSLRPLPPVGGGRQARGAAQLLRAQPTCADRCPSSRGASAGLPCTISGGTRAMAFGHEEKRTKHGFFTLSSAMAINVHRPRAEKGQTQIYVIATEAETIQHLLISCVFARQFWFFLLQRVGLAALSPNAENSFENWWAKSVREDTEKGLDSLIILGAWTLWIHRNDRVFNGAYPNIARALTLAEEEAQLWSLAGAKGLSFLSAPQLES